MALIEFRNFFGLGPCHSTRTKRWASRSVSILSRRPRNIRAQTDRTRTAGFASTASQNDHRLFEIGLLASTEKCVVTSFDVALRGRLLKLFIAPSRLLCDKPFSTMPAARPHALSSVRARHHDRIAFLLSILCKARTLGRDLVDFAQLDPGRS